MNSIESALGAVVLRTRERDEALAEVERLRGALRGISWMAGSGPSAAAQVLPNIKQRADEALVSEVKP